MSYPARAEGLGKYDIPESVQVNETHTFFWDFKIKTDKLIKNRLTDNSLKKKHKKGPAADWI